MKRFSRACLKPVAGALVSFASFASAAPPAAAAERPFAAPVQAAVPADSTPPPGPRPFFKTTKGKLVLALMVAGVGYVVYSKSHDRVPSPNR